MIIILSCLINERKCVWRQTRKQDLANNQIEGIISGGNVSLDYKQTAVAICIGKWQAYY